jgi:hypothetical protein
MDGGVGIGVWGLGFGVWGLGFGVWDLGLGFGVRGWDLKGFVTEYGEMALEFCFAEICGRNRMKWPRNLVLPNSVVETG